MGAFRLCTATSSHLQHLTICCFTYFSGLAPRITLWVSHSEHTVTPRLWGRVCVWLCHHQVQPAAAYTPDSLMLMRSNRKRKSSLRDLASSRALAQLHHRLCVHYSGLDRTATA